MTTIIREDDATYFRRRAVMEYNAAHIAHNELAAKLHRQLAALCERRVAEIDRPRDEVAAMKFEGAARRRSAAVNPPSLVRVPITGV